MEAPPSDPSHPQLSFVVRQRKGSTDWIRVRDTLEGTGGRFSLQQGRTSRSELNRQ